MNASNDPSGLHQIYHKLGNIEGKLDSLALIMTAHSAQDELRFSAIEKKLEPLQQSMWRNLGIATALSTMSAYVLLWLKGH